MDAAAAAAIVRNKCASRLIPFLEKTDPTSFINWESAFLMNAARTNWDDAEKKYQAKAKMSGPALAMCRHLDHNVEGQTAAQFLELLKAKFVPPAAGISARAAYRACKQLNDMTIKEYSSRLLELFFLAYPARAAAYDQDEDLIEKFITHLGDSKIAELCYGQNPETYTAAYNNAESLTSSQIIMASVRSKGSINQLQTSAARPQPEESNQRQVGTGLGKRMRTDQECWGCSRPGHQLKDCYVWQDFKRQRLNNGTPQRGRGRPFRSRQGRFRQNGNRRPFPGRVAEIAMMSTTEDQAELDNYPTMEDYKETTTEASGAQDKY